jgi:hypothetical protein
MLEHPFVYFEGGVPPIQGFEVNCEALLKLQEVGAFAREDASFLIVTTPPIALVSLMAFAEGFFKASFAAIGNMCPTALKQFVGKRPDASILLDDLLLLDQGIAHRIGSLTAERLDLGSAKKINAAFGDLAALSPFGTNEIDSYDGLLSVRNQLVHHGGIITARYFRQRLSSSVAAADIYWGSVEVTQRTVIDAIEFLLRIAKKLTDKAIDRMKALEGNKILESRNDRYPLFDYLRGDFSIFTPKK